MWTRIALKPWWARALTAAGVYAIVVAAGWCAQGLAVDPHRTLPVTLAGYVSGIAIFGVLAAAFTSNSHQACTSALAGLDPAQRSAAVDASFRGPVPVDAPVRDAAIRIAGRRTYSARIWRVMVVLIVLGAGMALAGRAWRSWDSEEWMHCALIVGFTVAAWHEWRSANHRLETLRRSGELA